MTTEKNPFKDLGQYLIIMEDNSMGVTNNISSDMRQAFEDGILDIIWHNQENYFKVTGFSASGVINLEPITEVH